MCGRLDKRSLGAKRIPGMTVTEITFYLCPLLLEA